MKAVVTAIVGIVIAFIIGLVVVGNLISNVNRSGWSAQANTTWTNLVGNVWTAFGLLVIIPLVLGAVVLLRMFSGGKGGGGF
ncbi:MAG: hypothetical protein QXL54_03215 [Candidatus Bathyarchaeia archaeon]